jgi:predicted AlkP superfamily phosphohydrolase/phosphomutase
MKTVVVGLDGAAFELIDPWIGEGALPNIARIKREGVWGDMRSVLPPVTSPNWKCYSTGKNPGKIGIFWWENIDWHNRKVYYPVARKLENKEIWDYMGEAGMKVGVLGMPQRKPMVSWYQAIPMLGKRGLLIPQNWNRNSKKIVGQTIPSTASAYIETSPAVKYTK